MTTHGTSTSPAPLSLAGEVVSLYTDYRKMLNAAGVPLGNIPPPVMRNWQQREADLLARIQATEIAATLLRRDAAEREQ